MKRPLSALFITIAVLLGQAGAIDLDLHYPIIDNGPGSRSQVSESDEAIDPCLNAGSLERNEHAETLLALSGFGIL